MAVTINGSTGIEYDDNVKHVLGTGDDLEIYHDATNSYISNSTGQLNIEGGSGGIDLIKGTYASGEWMLRAIADGAIELYHNGTKQFETVSGGCQFINDVKFDNNTTGGADAFWDSSDGDFMHYDGAKASWGNDSDLQIYHDGSHSYIKDTGTGRLIIASDLLEFRNAASDETTAAFVEDGQVELYYDNNLRFKTTSSGCQLRGTSNLVETLLRPYAATGVDLGTSADRFQNLYLHGNLYLGGTGSSNAMDDYEEGDWTPDLGNMTALSFNSRTGKYTKVGRFVYASCHMNIASRTGGGGHLLLTGLPFTSHNTNASGNGFIGYSAGLTGDTYDVPTIYIGSNATQAYFYKGNGSTFASQDIDFSSGSMHITFVYESA